MPWAPVVPAAAVPGCGPKMDRPGAGYGWVGFEPKNPPVAGYVVGYEPNMDVAPGVPPAPSNGA